jgi:uncharacterized linocin/CFP29 family protein
MDVIYNGKASGDVASRLLQCNFDTHCLRPYLGEDGRSYLAMNQSGVLTPQVVQNTTATLRYEDWKLLDDAIVKVAKPRLKAVADLRSAGLTYVIPNGMGKTVLETETMSDINPASVSMDGLRSNNNDRPLFEVTNLPLPIIHKDFSFSARQIMASRNGGSPLDTTSAELAARRVAEEAEKMLLGVSTVANEYAFGGGTIYGYTDYTNRLTKTITSPAASGWAGSTILTELLAMMKQAKDVYHYGPYILYVDSAWDQYLDNDYTTGYPKTVRARIKEIEGIQDVRTLDYFSTDYDMVLVQMTSDVVREVIGMDITTVEWDTVGGLQKNFKVMAIMVPQLRSDQDSNCGIVHASVA